MIPPAAALLALALSAAPQAPSLTPAQLDSLDKSISAYMSRHGIPGLSAAVALEGKVIWSKGYGSADLENSVPALTETAYRTASIGKTITATAAMKLVEEGKLELDRPIQEYCPSFPKKPWVITPRHLLTHQSGIRHYGGPRDQEEQTSTVHYTTVEAALAPFEDDPLLFEPGTEYSYSTYGFDVLGCVMEGAAHQPFMQIIRSYVFEPSGMTHTRDDDPAAIIPHRAAGYVKVNDELVNAPHVDMSNRLPAGGYLTTAPELAAFAARFVDCKLVSCETRDLMLTEQKLKNGDTVNYGLGWSIGEDASGKTDGTASHGGSSPGASGILYVVLKQRLAVVFLSNLESMPERFEEVRTIAAICAGSR
jgi:CubicO group peptidase (beta-lactamase class C family)